MKRRTFCKTAAALAAGALLPCTAVRAAGTEKAVVGKAVPDDYYEIRFCSDRAAADLTHEFYYSESFFEHSAREYDHRLALMTLGLANAALNTYESESRWWLDGNTGRTDNIAQAYRKLGFSNLQYMGYEQNMNTLKDADGCAMAQKTIDKNGRRTTVFAFMLRPTVYGVEWASNLSVGVGEGHEGFVTTTDRMFVPIKAYMDAAAGSTKLGTVKVWLGGYSRGAALANLLAAKLHKIMPEIPEENIFAYTFAAPAALTAADRPDLQQDYDGNHQKNGLLKDSWGASNIFNLISGGDIVPRVMPEAWGFHRNGNDRFLPATVRQEECRALDEAGRGFGDEPLVISQLATKEETDSVIDAVLRFCGSRESYHEKYEAAFADMIQCGLTRSEEEVTQDAVLDDEAVVTRLRTLPHIRAMAWSKVVRSVMTASAMSRPILERFGDAVPLRAQQIVVPVLAVGLCYDVEADVLKLAAYYIASLVSTKGRLDNAMRAAFCHYPENYIALMEYYAPEEHGMEAYTRR